MLKRLQSCWEANTSHLSDRLQPWTSQVNRGKDPLKKNTHFWLQKYAKWIRDQVYPGAWQHHSHLCHALQKKQTGVRPFGAKLLLRIKLTHQNKLLVAVEAPRDWHLQRLLDAGTLPPRQGPQFESEALDDWTCVLSQPVWRLSGLKNISHVLISLRKAVNLTHNKLKFPSFHCSLYCLRKAAQEAH